MLFFKEIMDLTSNENANEDDSAINIKYIFILKQQKNKILLFWLLLTIKFIDNYSIHSISVEV